MKKVITSSSTLWSCLIALVMMLAAQSAWAEYVKLTAIDGMLSYGQSALGSETYDKLVDGDTITKWGGWFNPALADEEAWPINTGESANRMYVIVKAEKAVTPAWYFLVTGNDTGNTISEGHFAGERNWASWKIYAGNFENDADAVRNGEGWTLVDNKEDEPLPAANFAHVNLEFDYTGTDKFQYFWIEITKSAKNADVYLQMSEWGLGSFSDYENYLKWLADQGTSTDEPVKCFLIGGEPAGFGGEGVGNLIDGKTNNKWCTGFTNRTATQEDPTANGAWIVFKASRPMAPTYYSMVTGNDTGGAPGRNWKTWRIYGMNAYVETDVVRNSDDWVLIDEKTNISAGTELNQLPAANFAQAFFSLSAGNTTQFRYFKIEIDECVNNGLMQMSEFSLGDEYTLAIDRNNLLSATAARYNAEDFAEAALYDQMAQVVADIEACNSPMGLGQLAASVDELVEQINKSKNGYAQLVAARNQALIQIADNNVADEALAYVNAWISETDVIEPNDDYPCGNFAYIKANRQLTGTEAAAEAVRFVAYFLAHTNTTPDPIATSVKYRFITGTTDNWNAAEGPASLIDGDRNGTKWGTGTGGDRFIIFKSIDAETEQDKPIKPSYYGLVTGGDTGKYTDRNWKNWKIWGANFASDEAATKDAEGWVLIDEKENVGTDVLRTTSLFESYINLSIGCTEPYKYFKIQVFHSGGMQMNEFTFYTQGDFYNQREEYVEEFADYDPCAEPAHKGYTDEYTEKYQEMSTSSYAPDLMRFKNELEDLQDIIATSVEKYAEYEEWVAELESTGAASEDLEAWFNGYTSENIAPNSVYINGTHEYIMENLQLDNDAIGKAAGFDIKYKDNGEVESKTEILPSGEIGYIQNMINAAVDGVYVLLGGHTVSQFNDGFYGHLIDGIALNGKDADGNTIKATKWGGSPDANGNTYIIFRTLNKSNPFFYTLTTGNDASVYTGRNWGSWKIYAANFDGDADATKDAEGWVVVDERIKVGQDRLHPVDAQPSYFGFSTETTEEYTYYKVEVLEAYSGTQIQMNELHFGTEEEFEEIKEEYTNNANEFEAADYRADKALIAEYIATVPEIDDCLNMEALFRVNYKLETLRAAIEASAALYDELEAKAEEYAAEAENLSASDAKTKLLGYITGEAAGPSEDYANGNVAYILDEHEYNDSIMQAELEFLEEMRVAAVAVGYGEGMDISCLIVNRTFAKAGEMLKNDKNENIGREAEGWNGYIYRTATSSTDNKIYAAEFVNNNKTFDVNQTLTDLKNGYYKVTLNAAYRANGDEKLLSYNYAAMAYANDVKTYIPVVLEYAVDSVESWRGTYPDHKIYTADSTEVLGWGPWGSEGAAHAFAQGRYAITLLAQVTDGTLTIGVKNEGTMGNEWTTVGNFGLVYLGEEMDADALAEAQEYAQARIEVLNDLYQPTTDDEEDYVGAPGFAAVQKAALEQNVGAAPFTLDNLKAIGETMEAIYYTKKAYFALFEATGKVYAKWWEGGRDDEVDGKTSEDAVYDVRANLDEGAYDDADAALAAKADLYAKFPDYLEITKENHVTKDEYESFTYDIQTEGARPYVDLMNIYEPLEKGEVIIAFDYICDAPVENGRVLYNTPNLTTDPQEQLDAIPAVDDWTTAYINVTKGINKLGFGTGTDHGIRWYINYNAGADDAFEIKVSKFRFITIAEMKAAGGRPLNGVPGDVNNDFVVDGGDAQQILNVMSVDGYDASCDVNGDNVVDGGDYQQILNIMSAQ